MASESKQKGRGTLLEAIQVSLRSAARYNAGDVVAPVAVLWTDAERQWGAIVEQLRSIMPELLSLGDYNPESRSGPAIWLRCVVEPKIRKENFPELIWPEDTIPVIYMPEVSRQTLKAVDECPEIYRPLVELQYRGTIWSQKNGRDWTLLAFLMNEDSGLGLDIAEDKQTLQAIEGALSKLAVTPVARLRGKRLEAEDFDKLMISDPPRELLLWLGNPEGTRKLWDKETWSAFRNGCRKEYGFDPEADGEIAGGELLGQRQDAWYGVWERFAESPGLYPGIPDLLRRAKPKGRLTFEKDPWPDENESMEDTLRSTLLDAGSMNAAEARQHLEQLEKDHGPRRGWVWACLGMSPLAFALEHLAALARQTMSTLGGESVDAMARLYAEGGYVADDCVIKALACVKNIEDQKAVRAAVRCIYLPWLEDTARHFQKRIEESPLPKAPQQDLIRADAGECILFADGLRFDLGKRLALIAAERQMVCSTSYRWAALPTVTATAKPAASPIAGMLQGSRLGPEFCPEIITTGEEWNNDRFRRLLTAEGFQILGPAEPGDPKAQEARGWTEFGEFDDLGHKLQSKLAARIEDQLELLLDRVQALLEAGWKCVRVVTDHGWLLVPGGLPKVQLPKYLAESRWSRCASIKENVRVEVPVAGWSWNPQERFAYGPGVHCFFTGNEYAHGGASLQECLIPILTFASAGIETAIVVKVSEIQWVGMRCRATITPATKGLIIDLRTKPNVPGSSIAQPKKSDAEGKVAMLVADDSLEGTMASLVVLNEAGRVICKEATTVGGEK